VREKESEKEKESKVHTPYLYNKREHSGNGKEKRRGLLHR